MDGNHKLNDHFIEQLNWRYAVKRFDPERKLSEEDVKTLEDALLLSPSSYGLQPWKFLIITDQKLKDELRPHAWNQPQISDCSHLVVMANKKYVGDEDVDVYLQRVMQVREIDFDANLQMLEKLIKGFRGKVEAGGLMREWTHKQTYIALGVLMATAAYLGIDACPMEGFEPAEFDRVLGLEKDGYTTAVLCTLGYRSAEDWLAKLAKVRYPRETIIQHI